VVVAVLPKECEVFFFSQKKAVLFSLCFALLLGVRVAAQIPAASSDLATIIGLIDQEKFSSLAEAKQLRENNKQNRQLVPLFDFSYSLILVKFGRWQEAIEILQPFADSRPQVFQARLLLIRCYIELEKFDNVLVETEKLLEKLPGEATAAEEVVQSTGLLVGFLNFARKDCPDELKLNLEQNARKKIPEPLQAKLQEAISLVESKVASIQAEIEKAAEKAEATAESKIANNLEEAERLRAEADAKAAELQDRLKDRQEKYEQAKLELQKMELEIGKLAARQTLLDNQVDSMRRNLLLLERPVTREDRNGNRTTTTEITDQIQYNRLNRMIGNSLAEMQTVEANARVLSNNYQQLKLKASGLADEKQRDELSTKNKVNQLSSQAQSKQKRAEREADRKGKNPLSAARGPHARLKSYGTYDALDIATNKQYLDGIAKRFLP
jgi:chromosome segregation ATPase